MRWSLASRPGQAVPVAVGVEQLELGHPVELVGALERVPLETGQHRLPAVQHVAGGGVGLTTEAFLDEALRVVEVLPLQLYGGHRAAVTDLEQMGQGRIVRHLLERGHRARDAQVGREEPLLDHREHQRRRADLEVGRGLGQVRVAQDHVQPAVLLGVGVRLVAGVDDRPLQGGLQPDLHLEVVRALGQLEAVAMAVLAQTDPAGPRDDLTAHEEGRQVAHDVAEGVDRRTR